MIKCFFIDVRSISSDRSLTDFDEAEIERLADSILAMDGLIWPLIIRQTGLEQYAVLDGHLAYYAAVRARDKNVRQAETVNAFVIPDELQQVAIDQLNLLAGAEPTALPISIPSPTNITLSIEELTSIVDRQMQPLQQELSRVILQLSEQQKLLLAVTKLLENNVAPSPANYQITQDLIDRQATIATDAGIQLIEAVNPLSDRIVEPKLPQLLKPKIPTEPKKTRTTTSKAELDPAIDPVKVPVEPKLPQPLKPKIPTEPKKPRTTTKSKAALDPAIDPIKAANALKLINTLNSQDLQLRMSKSGVAAGAVKLVDAIVSQRDIRADGKFASWEDVMSEIAGLKAATAKSIIEKLK